MIFAVAINYYYPYRLSTWLFLSLLLIDINAKYRYLSSEIIEAAGSPCKPDKICKIVLICCSSSQSSWLIYCYLRCDTINISNFLKKATLACNSKVIGETDERNKTSRVTLNFSSSAAKKNEILCAVLRSVFNSLLILRKNGNVCVHDIERLFFYVKFLF